LPTLATYGTAVVNLPDGSQVKGIISERKLFNSKDIYGDIYEEKHPLVTNKEMLYDIINQDTVVELEKMKEIIIKNNIEINDFQVMFGEDGRPVVADPKDIGIGKDADEGEVSITIDKIKNIIIMIKNIANKKPIIKAR